MKKIKLLYRGRKPITVDLTHGVYCVALGSCACHLLPVTTTGKDAQGRPTKYTKEAPRPSALHLLPNVPTAPIPEAVLQVPAIAAGVADKTIQVVELTAAPSEPAPAPRRRRR